MTTSDIELAAGPVGARASSWQSVKAGFVPRPGYLVSPVVDFLCLGGASLIVLPLMVLLLPVESTRAEVILIAALLANLINHPHFAHSYQIFYRDFRTKAFGAQYSRGLRMRYVFAGIAVPLLLGGFFVGASLAGAPRVLGLAVNAMGFAVGWHYVKQGYGMLMVDSVLKRRFFADREKKFFLVNGYAAWIFAWMMLNQTVAENDFWGLKYFTLAVPQPLIYAAGALLAATTAALIVMLARKASANGGKLPWVGLMAYATSLYVWVVLVRINPLVLLVVPAFHSLQYLLVVWRFQWNLESDRANVGPAPVSRGKQLRRFAGFVVAGIVLGFMGFWFLPSALQLGVAYDKAYLGPALFLFGFWLFINLHHYFIDNVIWRRENPDTKKYLFGAR